MLKQFFINLFKTKNQIYIESKFDFLVEEGFQKEFINYGKELTLVYKKLDIEFSLTWESRSRPCFFLLKKDKIKFDFANVYKRLQQSCPLDTSSLPRINYWVWNTLSYDDFLNEYIIELKRKLNL